VESRESALLRKPFGFSQGPLTQLLGGGVSRKHRSGVRREHDKITNNNGEEEIDSKYYLIKNDTVEIIPSDGGQSTRRKK